RRSCDGGEVRRRVARARCASGAGRSRAADGARRDAESSGSRGAGGNPRREPRRHGRSRPTHPCARPAIRAREGRTPQGRPRGSLVDRPRAPRVLGAAGRFAEHAWYRLHVLGRDHRRPRARPGAERRDPRGQGLRDASHPRWLHAGPRRGSAAALPDGMVMNDTDEGKMSFFEHLAELRSRILWSLVAAGVGLVISPYFTDRVMKSLVDHVLKIKPVFTSPTEGFWTYMKVAMILGLFIAMPVVLWNVWAFIAPGLHKHEKKYAAPFVIIGSVLFLLGGAFALLVVVPFAVQFLVNFGQQQGLQPMLSISSSVDFILKFTLAFGLVFELPVVITLLSMIGVVTPQFLSKNRKYAILINFITAAVLTPTPDALNQTLMAGPLIVLYEIGIISARIFGRKAEKAAAAAAAPADGSAS